jgi:hypothetical protein
VTNELTVKELDVMTLGQVLAQSGYFADAKQAGQAVVKVLAGQELGFGPIASMTGIHVIKGKVTLSANLIGAAVKRSGRYEYFVDALDEKQCVITFYQRLDPGAEAHKVGVSSFTIADAKAAGLVNGENWKKYPRNMLFARAMSNGAKWFCPDVFGGPVYTPDELGAIVDGETGEVVDITPEPEPERVNENGLTDEEIIAKNRALLIGRIEDLNAQLETPDDSSNFLNWTETELTAYGMKLRERVDEASK